MFTPDNKDSRTVASFGDEWSRFDQSQLSATERQKVFDEYFAVFPWSDLPAQAIGLDVGCGSGRWATLVAPRVGTLHCLDASAEALAVAKRSMINNTNIIFHHASVAVIPLPDNSLDFAYSLGVLHHVPDTSAAISACVRKLKPGAPLLLYLYYAFENRPWWFRALWRISDLGRRIICRMPAGLKSLATDLIALTVYWPLSRLTAFAERLNIPVDNWPLAYYRNHSFYTLRTDARDRFGTPLEQRFTLEQIKSMMIQAGLEHIEYSPNSPYWCVVGRRCPKKFSTRV